MAGEKIHEVIPVKRWLSEDGGDPLQMDLILNPTFDGERRFAGVTGLAVNVSDRVDAASARAESEQKSAFLAAMSHELRTPLNSIMGFSQLLDLPGAKPALTAKQKRYISHIISSGSHLLALVGDILDLAKVGAGQLEVNLEAVSLHDLVLDPVDRVGSPASGQPEAKKHRGAIVYLPSEWDPALHRIRTAPARCCSTCSATRSSSRPRTAPASWSAGGPSTGESRSRLPTRGSGSHRRTRRRSSTSSPRSTADLAGAWTGRASA